MFREILVPLDGSKLSEASLTAAGVLASRLGSSLTLLHVLEQSAPSEVHHERHLTAAEDARSYLQEVAMRAFPGFTRIRTHVHDVPVADLAQSIVEHAADEFKPDLIVTCTHGKGGVRDLLVGSIAQQIVAQGRVPLLLIRPDLAGFDVKRILVPLDPDSVHDAGLEPSTTMAAALGASVELLSVIPTVATLTGEEAVTSTLLPTTAEALLQLREEAAGDHLEQHVEAIKQAGLACAASVARGDPATEILRSAQRLGADLIVLSTHRKAGIGAFWSKSVAPRVAQATRIPLLLVPLP